MARTVEDRVERLEDGTAAQGLLLQSHQSTIDLVLKPMQDRQEGRDVEVQELRGRMDRAEASVRTSTWILGGLLALLTLLVSVWGALK